MSHNIWYTITAENDKEYISLYNAEKLQAKVCCQQVVKLLDASSIRIKEQEVRSEAKMKWKDREGLEVEESLHKLLATSLLCFQVRKYIFILNYFEVVDITHSCLFSLIN